jgi:hypothetical protein
MQIGQNVCLGILAGMCKNFWHLKVKQLRGVSWRWQAARCISIKRIEQTFSKNPSHYTFGQSASAGARSGCQIIICRSTTSTC